MKASKFLSTGRRVFVSQVSLATVDFEGLAASEGEKKKRKLFRLPPPRDDDRVSCLLPGGLVYWNVLLRTLNALFWNDRIASFSLCLHRQVPLDSRHVVIVKNNQTHAFQETERALSQGKTISSPMICSKINVQNSCPANESTLLLL